MITQFSVTGHIPSKKNSRRLFVRQGKIINLPSEAYEKWEREHLLDLIGWEQLKPPYQIIVTFYAPTKRKEDLTNKIESINDLLVKAGVLTDDNWFELNEVCLRFGGVDKVNPRAEVRIISA